MIDTREDLHHHIPPRTGKPHITVMFTELIDGLCNILDTGDVPIALRIGKRDVGVTDMIMMSKRNIGRGEIRLTKRGDIRKRRRARRTRKRRKRKSLARKIKKRHQRVLVVVIRKNLRYKKLMNSELNLVSNH